MNARAFLLAVLCASAVLAYTDGFRGPGEPPTRNPNAEAMRFLVDSSAAAGVRNSDQEILITEDSDPVAALRSAVESWSAIADSRIRFEPFELGSAEVSARPDQRNVITFRDTPENRSLVGDANAVTSFFFIPGDNVIVETDIVFNPDARDIDGGFAPFSTTGRPDANDIESIFVHELGHALGAKHSAVGGATMWQTIRAGSLFGRTLAPDDEMFAIQAYPRAGALGRYGRIRGAARFAGGGPIRGGLAVAVSPNGAVVSALTDLQTGQYEIVLPAGEYFVYLDPPNGPLGSAGLQLDSELLDESFATTLFGGNDTPATVAVAAGSTVTADITAPAGDPPLEISSVGERSGGFILIGNGPREIPVNEITELFFWGPGLGDVREGDVRVLGPELVLVPGSVAVSPQLEFNGRPALRMRVRAVTGARPTQATGAGSLGTILITRQGHAAAYTGGVVVENLLSPLPSPDFSTQSVVNAASFAPGPVAPGELVSIFGLDLGPAAGVSTPGFGANGLLPTTLADVQVTFDGVPAPLVFVSANQINAQVPFEAAGRASTTAVVTYRERFSQNVTLPVASSAPGVFFVASGAPAISNQDGSLNTPANPESRGHAVVVFATGQGVVDPPIATGQGAPITPLSGIGLGQVSATIGGRPAQPLFAGLTPGFVGLLQVNLLVPADAPAGPAVPLSLALRGRPAQDGVTVSIAP